MTVVITDLETGVVDEINSYFGMRSIGRYGQGR
jgi:hypothetical protein